MSKELTIELIHPPHPQAIEDRLDAPLGLLYIAGMLESEGYNVRINDLSGVDEKDWRIGKADIYGITMYAPTIEMVERIAGLCKEKNKRAKVVVGGAHPTAVPETISSVFDCVVIGEGELAFLEILEDYPENKRFYQKELSSDLDLYPNPAYHLVDLKSYKRTINGKPAITILTSRGCPFNCAFCALTDEHRTVKFRSAEAVTREIKEIQIRYGISSFNFQDDTFTLHKSRLYNLLKLLEPLDISFRCHGRAGLDMREDYRRLKRAGCSLLAWGIESGSQRMLDRMNKQATVADNMHVISWAKELRITTRAFFLIGFPGETEETIEETKRFIEEADPDQYFVSNFVPFPATDVWSNPEKYGVTSMNRDFCDYYQVEASGLGGVNIETKVLSREKFREIEKDFRSWISRRKRRGNLLEYERKLEKDASFESG